MSDINLLNYTNILSEIDKYKKSSNSPILIAVSKKQPNQKIQALIDIGQLHFGENYVIEAKGKFTEIPQNINLHLIGNLQKNKSKYCPNLFNWIHTIDDLSLANVINNQYLKNNLTVECLIQMNLTGELTKNGIVDESQLYKLVAEITKLPAINIRGLMTIPDPNITESETAIIYKKLAILNQKLAKSFQGQYKIDQLSCGMSNDYKIALSEGATMIRIGTAIFGDRII